MRGRLSKYIILALLTATIPFIAIGIIIMVSGDRMEGLTNALTAMIIPQFIFGLYFIQKKWVYRIPLSILISAIALGLLIFAMRNGLYIKTHMDMYGYWNIALCNFLAGILSWELFYQIDRMLKKSHVDNSVDKLWTES